MKLLPTLATLVTVGSAFPVIDHLNADAHVQAARLATRTLKILEEEGYKPVKRAFLPSPSDALGLSRSETNCGPTIPCPYFNEKEQYVSVEGEYAYAAPGPDEIRGPCPGLNAAANHGYLPRSGVASLEETVRGLNKLYNLGVDLGAFLAAYAIVIDGDLAGGTWSIGGPQQSDPLTPGLGNGQGLSYSHNSYEGDGSIGRLDAFTNHGDAHSLSVEKFEKVYAVGGNDTSEDGLDQRFTIDKFRARYQEVQEHSIATNPYYFTGAFSTIVVVPAAYNFVINFMSNHSKEEPSGYLDGYNFKQFFGITGKPGSFVWNKGQERVPKNWYKRPTISPYGLADVAADVGIGYLAYPKTLKVGGNTGKVNSFTGVSVEDLTGGVLNAKSLFEGDNFACFAFVLAEQAIPHFLKGPLESINNATSFLKPFLSPILGKLECPELGNFDQSLFNDFPGYKYKPNGPDTNY
ncbi:hypothetical protein NUU61_001938 [Penicillium alfredii]|uniref:Heme haloperoxidase family profile domain-containing protein n=1 Tax=Penicillium alfredii TaxID=1506179 RepID=A0A9W9FQK9_9EURO|nr:uncharacterized protein NUU61_001938 [Penicillium alfredii]KAJ5104591.1 hypothetical protein NUU61_001938 [Penicillium alfredii]